MRVPKNFLFYLARHESCSEKILTSAEGLKPEDLELATDPDLVELRKMVYSVLGEVYKMMGFVRLKPYGRHILYGYLKPRHRIEDHVCDHFARKNQGVIIVLGNSTQSHVSLFIGGEVVRATCSSLMKTLDDLAAALGFCEDAGCTERIWEVYYKSQYSPERRNIKAFQRRIPKKALRSAGLGMERNLNGSTLDDFLPGNGLF